MLFHQGFELHLNPRQRGLVVALEAQHQHRRGVGSAPQTETVGEFGAQAIDGNQLLQSVEPGGLSQIGNQCVAIGAFGQGDIQFGGGHAFRQGFQHGAGVRAG